MNNDLDVSYWKFCNVLQRAAGVTMNTDIQAYNKLNTDVLSPHGQRHLRTALRYGVALSGAGELGNIARLLTQITSPAFHGFVSSSETELRLHIKTSTVNGENCMRDLTNHLALHGIKNNDTDRHRVYFNQCSGGENVVMMTCRVMVPYRHSYSNAGDQPKIPPRESFYPIVSKYLTELRDDRRVAEYIECINKREQIRFSISTSYPSTRGYYYD